MCAYGKRMVALKLAGFGAVSGSSLRDPRVDAEPRLLGARIEKAWLHEAIYLRGCTRAYL